MTLFHFAMVGAGGFLGAIARFKVSGYMSNKFPSMFPYGTLAINLLGSFLLGLLLGHIEYSAILLFAGTGFMGAFTTFSTLKLDSVRLLEARAWLLWVLYTAFSYTFGILLAYLGYIL